MITTGRLAAVISSSWGEGLDCVARPGGLRLDRLAGEVLFLGRIADSGGVRGGRSRRCRRYHGGRPLSLVERDDDLEAGDEVVCAAVVAFPALGGDIGPKV